MPDTGESCCGSVTPHGASGQGRGTAQEQAFNAVRFGQEFCQPQRPAWALPFRAALVLWAAEPYLFFHLCVTLDFPLSGCECSPSAPADPVTPGSFTSQRQHRVGAELLLLGKELLGPFMGQGSD